MEDAKTSTGAVRSGDGEYLDFVSLPVIGLIAVAKTTHEGGTKYSRYNYMQGFPAWKLVNRSLRHIFLWALGDRSEPNLEHAAWGLLAAIQELTLNGDVHRKDLLGPGATLTAEMLAFLESEAPRLEQFRKTDEAKKLGKWQTSAIPEVAMILEQRQPPPKPVRDPDQIDDGNRGYCPSTSTRKLVYEPRSTIHPSFRPGTTNASVFGHPTRTEPASAKLGPRPGETWTVFESEDGDFRCYFDEDPKARKATYYPLPERLPKKSARTASHEPTQTAWGKITPVSEGGDHMGGAPPLP